MKLNPKQIKVLRTVGHSLSPIVTVADRGLTDTVIAAINEALETHELVKVKVRHERELRNSLCEQICQKTGAVEIQQIGMILLIYKQSKQSKNTLLGPKLKS
mgnify:CR=1 FL=1